jgi:TPP-dependent pyruvate/acetoin dehydrogenase alpha subunit
MEKETKETGISRRCFIKGIGGVAASAAVLGSLKTVGAQPIPRSVALPKDTLLEMYRRMQRIRKGELKLLELFLLGKGDRSPLGIGVEGIRRTGHSSEGQEASCVGVCMAMNKGDYLTCSHRSHGHPLALGMDLKRWMGEMFGRTTGSARGHGGSMHIVDAGIGLIGASGIVGAGVPHCVGAARAAKIRGTDQVAVPVCGDGGMNTSSFNGSLNLAASWNLPVVFVVDNNQWQVSVRNEMVHALVQKGKDLSTRAAGWGIPGITVDGNDVFAVYKAAKYCIDNARAGKGPSLLECVTYRQRCHNESYAAGEKLPVGAGYVSHEVQRWPYNDRAQLDYWLARDPIKRFDRCVLEAKLLTEAELEATRKEVATEIEVAVEFARSSPFPDPEEEFKYIRKVYGA